MTLLTKICDYRHSVCYNNMLYFKNDKQKFNNADFDKFINTILQNSSTYNNCLSNYSNKKSEELIDYILFASATVEIDIIKFVTLSQYIVSDIKVLTIIKNQKKIKSSYIKDLIINKRGFLGENLNFILICLKGNKINTLNFLLENMSISSFIDIIPIIKDNIGQNLEKIFCDFINKNREGILKEKRNLNLVDNFINKPKILKIILNIVLYKSFSEQKLDILNKVLLSNILDPSLILIILEGSDVIPNDISITNLLSKVYFRSTGAINAKIIAEIIDIFILYGFKITKDIIVTLLKKSCYINSIEKYQIPIDNFILEHCATIGYYPYDFTCVPSDNVMLIECKKECNLDMIKKLKEKGGILNTQCLEKACGVKKNGRVIKYIITECKVKPNDECLNIYQTTNGLEALDILMKNYDNTKEKTKSLNNKILLDNDSTMTIEKKNIEINNEIEYTLKTKIKKLFNYKKKTIKYFELYELMLKYLINHNLIIGNYFVINNELCNLLKISQCTIVNIDQLENILSYFIDVAI